MEKIAYAKLLSKSLNVATGESNVYRCPLCLAPFSVQDADLLTWDHYPPQSVGGRDRDIVLVCQDCHRQWSPTDAELARLMRREEFDRLYPGMEPVILRIPDEPYVKGLRHREAIGVRGRPIRLVGRPEHNVQEATQRLTEFLNRATSEGKWNGLKITVSSDPQLIYSTQRIERSFLKAAYLAAFDCLGYPYVLSPALNTLRQQMREPDVAHLTDHTVIFSPQLPGFDREILLAYVHTPEPVTGLAVFFLGYNLARWQVTFLLLPAHPEMPKYGQLDQSLRKAGGMGFVSFERSRELTTDAEVTLVDQNDKEWPIYSHDTK